MKLNIKYRRVLAYACLTIFAATCGVATARTPNNTDGAKTLLIKPIAAARSFEKRALVIGISNYETVPSLPACASDARQFAGMLQTRWNFPTNSIQTIIADGPDKGDYVRLLNAVQSFLDSINDDSEVVFYFSGHGTRDPETGEDYLVPQNGNPRLVKQTCVSYDAIRRQLETKNPRRAILIVDACRDLTGDAKGTGKGSGFGGNAGSKAPEIAELLSCQPTQVSHVGKTFPESVFTHFLLQGLNGDPEAQSANGAVTFDSLSRYVRGNVSDYVRAEYPTSAQSPIGKATLGAMLLAKFDAVPIPPVLPAPQVINPGVVNPPVLNAPLTNPPVSKLPITPPSPPLPGLPGYVRTDYSQLVPWRVINAGTTINALKFSPDGTLLAGGAGGKVALWSPQAELVRTLSVSQQEEEPFQRRVIDEVLSLAFRPDSKILAAGLSTGGIQLWDVATGQPSLTLTGHKGAVTAVDFSPDGKFLARWQVDRQWQHG